jgi:hypothetical protein
VVDPGFGKIRGCSCPARSCITVQRNATRLLSRHRVSPSPPRHGSLVSFNHATLARAILCMSGLSWFLNHHKHASRATCTAQEETMAPPPARRRRTMSGSQASATSPPPSDRKVNRSCVECTRRKIKCDGRHPCGSCVYYRNAETCEFRQRSRRNAVSRRYALCRLRRLL